MDLPRAAHGLRMVAMRSDEVMGEVATAIGGAERSVTAEHFVFNDPTVTNAARQAAERGVAGAILGDAEMLALGRIDTPKGFDVVAHGSATWKVHTKITTIDGTRSLLSTAGMTATHREKPTLDFLFETRSAQDASLLEEMGRAGLAGDHDRIVAAADSAASAGFLFNDPAHGVLHLRRGLKGLADATTGDAYVATKVLNEDKLLRRFAAATRQSGASLRVDTHGGTQKWRPAKEAAKRAGADVKRIGADAHGLELHGNVVVAQTSGGPRMIVMTAPFSHRGLGERGAPRMGREVGVMIRDPGQIRAVLDRLGELEGSRAKKVSASIFG